MIKYIVRVYDFTQQLQYSRAGVGQRPIISLSLLSRRLIRRDDDIVMLQIRGLAHTERIPLFVDSPTSSSATPTDMQAPPPQPPAPPPPPPTSSSVYRYIFLRQTAGPLCVSSRDSCNGVSSASPIVDVASQRTRRLHLLLSPVSTRRSVRELQPPCTGNHGSCRLIIVVSRQTGRDQTTNVDAAAARCRRGT